MKGRPSRFVFYIIPGESTHDMKLLSQINDPADLRRLPVSKLQPLADERKREPLARGGVRRFLLSPAFAAVVFAAALIQSSHAVYYSFSSLDWASWTGRSHAQAPASLDPDMTIEHVIFIPGVLLVGVVIGFTLGSRAVRAEFERLKRRAKE